MTKEELESQYVEGGTHVRFGDGDVQLDGWFTREQLREIAELLDGEQDK